MSNSHTSTNSDQSVSERSAQRRGHIQKRVRSVREFATFIPYHNGDCAPENYETCYCGVDSAIEYAQQLLRGL